MPKVLILSFILMIGLTPNFVTATPANFRWDLQKKLSTLLCKNDEEPSAKHLWQKKIFDTQTKIYWIDADHVITEPDLEKFAQLQAVNLHHNGFAYGYCTHKRAWVMTTHATDQIFTRDKDQLKVNQLVMHPFCKTFDLDHAENQSSKLRSIISGKKIETTIDLKISLKDLSQGILSLTCHPFDDSPTGPQLWAILPIGLVKLQNHLQNIENDTQLISWIQDRRHAAGVQSLKIGHPTLNQIMSTLRSDDSLNHPHAWLVKQKAKLSEAGIQLLGENRVKARSHKMIAWLLWNSPQHRRLILEAEANTIVYRWEVQASEKHLTLLLAHTSSIND